MEEKLQEIFARDFASHNCLHYFECYKIEHPSKVRAFLKACGAPSNRNWPSSKPSTDWAVQWVDWVLWWLKEGDNAISFHDERRTETILLFQKQDDAEWLHCKHVWRMDNGQLQKVWFKPCPNLLGCHRRLQERHSWGHNILGHLRSEGLLLCPEKCMELNSWLFGRIPGCDRQQK